MTGCEGCAGKIGICDLLQVDGQYMYPTHQHAEKLMHVYPAFNRHLTCLPAVVKVARSEGCVSLQMLSVFSFQDTCSSETLFQTISSLPQNCMYRQAGLIDNQTCSSCVVSQCKPAGPYIKISESTPNRGSQHCTFTA